MGELIILFLERNFFSLATFIILLVIILRGADKIFPKLKKAKVTTPAGGIEFERDNGDDKENEERRDCANNRGRRATDVCNAHCNIAQVIEANTSALEELKKADKKLFEHDDEHWIDLLQVKFCMAEMPKSTRMIAGLTLLWWGINGDFKVKVLKFKDENPSVYDDIVDARPELRIGNYAKGRNPEHKGENI